MNLRQNPASNESETKSQKHAWYHAPETTQVVPTVPATRPLQVKPEQTLFEPSAAERILARAGALQEVHGQMQSTAQIEAVAAEVGIKPEFVHLAIEEEKIGTVAPSVAVVKPQPRSLAKVRTVTTGLAGTLVFAGYNIAAYRDVSRGGWIFALLIFPLLLSFALGLMGRSRRSGVISGFVVGATPAVALMVLAPLEGKTMPTDALQAFLVLVAVTTLFGGAGAQARRVVSRRQASNRSNQSNRTLQRTP
jgi:hypothetical protein